MNKSGSAIESISPALQHVKLMLFRPIDPGRWIILGFLSFLQLLGDGGGSGANNAFRLPGGNDRHPDEVLRGAVSWIADHWTIVAVLGFFGILVALILIVLFKWLSSRATFCYIDCVATNRADVVRPWREHAQIADSYFFFRLVVSVCVLVLFTLLAIPIALSVWSILRSGEELSVLRMFFGTGIVAAMVLCIVILVLAALVLRVLLVDFTAPIQYLRRIRCREAFRIVIGLVKQNLGAFVLYFILKILIAIVLGFAVFALGCGTCCVGFCCMMIPVLGQALLQPVHIFKRAFPLFFLGGFGTEFDVFFVPAGPPGGAGGSSGAGEFGGAGSSGGGWGSTTSGPPVGTSPFEPSWGGPSGSGAGGSIPSEPGAGESTPSGPGPGTDSAPGGSSGEGPEGTRQP